MILTNARLVTTGGREPGWVRVEGGVIAAIGEGGTPADGGADGDVVDVEGAWVGPGFIDTHLHGGFGVDVSDADPRGLLELADALVQHGVTSFVPTTASSSRGETLRQLAAIEAARTSQATGAAILGVHMEGPFLSAACKGAHHEHELRDASLDELEEFLRSTEVRIMTIAPERAGSAAVIDELVRRGVVVSVGHSAASFDQVERAVAAGAASVTHLFNGMRPMHHRSVGLVGAALLMPELTCELIADGVHVAPGAMAIAAAMKGIPRIVLVSDAGRSAGGHRRDAEATRLSDGTLASSAAMLDEGFAGFRAAAGLGIAEAWPVASTNAARLLGLSGKGAVRAGADADLTVMDDAGSVTMTIVAGRVLFRR